MLGKIEEEKGMTEDTMVGWHHRLNGREFEQARELVMDTEAWCTASLVPCEWLQVFTDSTLANSQEF